MGCSLYTLAGIAGDCEASKGGIKNVWIANYDSVTPAYDTTANTITGVTFSGSESWHKYALRKGVGSMTSTLNVDAANGINYVSSSLVLQFSKMDTAKRMEMKALSFNDIVAVAEDCNGKKWYLGYEEPVEVSAGSAQTGQARGDGNFYNITLESNDSTFLPEFTGEIE